MTFTIDSNINPGKEGLMYPSNVIEFPLRKRDVMTEANPGAVSEDRVTINGTEWHYSDVVTFIHAAEALRKDGADALYATLYARLSHTPLHAPAFPVGHPWLTDAHQLEVALALVGVFYRFSPKSFGNTIRVFQLQGIISSFTFSDERRRLELMKLFESYN